MDLDAFECPICLSLFQGSIFQCKNGHVVCDSCRVHINGTCPSCREPVGKIRCRALENAIAGMAFPCKFSNHGCTQLLKHAERREHEAFLCHHASFACPVRGCAYSGLLLYDHIQDAHSRLKCINQDFGCRWRVWLHRRSKQTVLLDPVDRRVFLLLNGGGVRSGRSLSVVCLGPRPAANQPLKYKLEVGGGAAAGEPRALSLSASGSVPCVRSWEATDSHGFLFVPDAYWTYTSMELDLGLDLDFLLVDVRVYTSLVRRLHDFLKPFLDLLFLDRPFQLFLLVLVFVCSAMAVVLEYRRGALGKASS